MALAGAALVIRSPAYGIAIAAALAPLINTVLSSGGGGFAGQPLQVLVPALAVRTLVYGLLVSSSWEMGRETRLLAIAIAIFTTRARGGPSGR